MNSIDLGVSTSKVKFTVASTVKIVSAHFLENYINHSEQCESKVRKGWGYMFRLTFLLNDIFLPGYT